jgi:hypothetical protein
LFAEITRGGAFNDSFVSSIARRGSVGNRRASMPAAPWVWTLSRDSPELKNDQQSKSIAPADADQFQQS